VEVEWSPAVDDAGPAPDPDVGVPVVYADADVIVVDKPSGLVVHPGAGHDGGTLVNGLVAVFPELRGVGDLHRPGVVHRLDKDTSGLLVVARTPAAHQSLTAQLKSRSVQRRYLALVWGRVAAAQGLIDAPIGRSARTPTKMAVSTKGREARTAYEVIAAYTDPAELTLLRCRLETGRTHQIRVHLAAIGHPVVGDSRYGGRHEPLADVPRFFLHAEHLAFTHPVTGDELAFDSPLPEDLKGIVARLRH